MMRNFIVLGLVAAMSLTASAQLVNANMETQTGDKFSTAENWAVIGGGWADHAGFVAGPVPPAMDSPDNLLFIFYSQEGTQVMGQISSLMFAPNTTYEFTSWAVGGGGIDETIPYQIGYIDTPDGTGNIATEFVELSKDLRTVSGRNAGGVWSLTAGTSYTTGAAGPELGKPVVVRFGNGADGAAGGGGAWIDNAMLTPEPSSLLLLALAGLGLRRRF